MLFRWILVEQIPLLVLQPELFHPHAESRRRRIRHLFRRAEGFQFSLFQYRHKITVSKGQVQVMEHRQHRLSQAVQAFPYAMAICKIASAGPLGTLQIPEGPVSWIPFIL